MLWIKLENVALMGDVQKHTNFQQIIVGSLGKAPPPPELNVPIMTNFLIGILTDPLPPDRDNVTIIAVFIF